MKDALQQGINEMFPYSREQMKNAPYSREQMKDALQQGTNQATSSL